MGRNLRNISHELQYIIVDGQVLSEAESIEWNAESETQPLRAGGAQFPYAIPQYGSAVQGTITLRHLDPNTAKTLYGGNALASGISLIYNESVTTTATGSNLTAAAAGTPLQSGFIIVKSPAGNMMRENKTGAPGVGEFAYNGATSVKFNAAETGTTATVSYGVYNASGNTWEWTDTAVGSYVNLVAVPKGESIDTAVIVYPAKNFPKTKFTGISEALQVGSPGTITLTFFAVADATGKAVRNCVVSG